jgi:LPXTG-motif cell wall-anchored protein
VLTGSFTVPQKVPEAGNTATILGMGIIGTGLLLRQRRKTVLPKLN